MVCPACGVFVREDASVCPSCSARLGPAPRAVAYAGFWLRVLAYLIDTVVLAFVSLPLIMYLLRSSGMADLTPAQLSDPVAMQSYAGPMFLLEAILFVGVGLYFSVMESSPWQATLGKRVVGLEVVGLDGKRLSFGRATARYFAKMLSNLSLLIGYVMAAFTPRKQALHDIVVGSLVIRKG